MFCARRCGRAARLVLLVTGLMVAPGHRVSTCSGQQPDTSAGSSFWTPVPEALKATMSTGRPTVVLLTSRACPESLQLKAAISNHPVYRTLAASMPLTEMTAEAYPDQCKGLTLADLPFVAVYRRGQNGPELAGSRKGVRDIATMYQWLASLGLVNAPGATANLNPTGVVDPNVARATLSHGDATPSSQYPASPQAPPQYTLPAPAPAPAPAPPQYYAPQPTYSQPAYAAPIPANPPTYVSLAPPTMVVQQQPQQIIIGPAPPPQVTVVSMGAAPPTNGLAPALGPAPAPPAGAAPPNLMMPAPAPPAAPAPPTNYAPPGYSPAPGYGLAPAALAPAGAAPGMVIANAPGPIDRMLAGIGRGLVRRGYPRVALAEAPAAYAPAPGPFGYGPPVGYLPLAQPVQSFMPTAAYAPAPQQYYAPAPQPQPLPPLPSGPVPSPQSGNSGHHFFSLFH